jgi:CheY-like chemotaxis protein
MRTRVTMIEDSRESQLRFLQSLSADEQVDLQPITNEPFFDDEIEMAIRDFNPDLIILDLRLSRNNDSGFRVLRKLKESPHLKDIPVVVCSKYIDSSSKDPNRLMALEYGAIDALPKIPFPKAGDFLKYARSKSDDSR